DVEEAVISRAIQKVTGENDTREALLRGESLQSVFQRYGIL
ncbi:MAG: RraA family protein, partial [Burkholderiaceae bacterium]|nr:RraA family protein [Burkholderiaceae bacterium]